VKNKPEFKSPEHRREKIVEHSNLEQRKSVRDKRYYVIDDDEEIDRLLADDLTAGDSFDAHQESR
jgi:hypothetical protein